MITFILLGFFFLLAILFGAVAYTSNQRQRAGMKGVDPALEGRRKH
jgi:preprotein translocase subunit SecG